MNSVKNFTGEYVKIETRGNVAIMELNRPPANALDIPTIQELRRAVDTISEDSSINVAILISGNPKIFCGGADISTVEEHDPEGMDFLGKVIKDLTLAMRSSPKVFIAEIAGHCLGGGLELALSCDFRIGASVNAKVGLPEVNLGLFPGGGGIQLVGRLIGPQIAFELAATGELISIQRAHEIGLIDHLYSPEEVRAETIKFAEKLAQGPMIAISNMKQAVYRGLAMGIEEAFDFERQMHKHLVATEDCRDGVKAFKEKRRPQFKGR